MRHFNDMLGLEVPAYSVSKRRLIPAGTEVLRGRVTTLPGLMVVTMRGDYSELNAQVAGIEKATGTKLVPLAFGSNACRFDVVTGEKFYELKLVFAKGTFTEGDLARQAKLNGRLQESSEYLGVFRVLVEEYEADGHCFFPKHGRIAEIREEIDGFQITGYPVVEEGRDRGTLRPGVLKGLAVVDDRGDITFPEGIDLVANKNIIKLVDCQPGDVLNVALFKQSHSLESQESKMMSIPWQAATRMLPLLTEEGFRRLLGRVDAMGLTIAGDLSSGRSLFSRMYGKMNNEFTGVIEKMVTRGLPVGADQLDKLAGIYLQDAVKIRDEAFRVYAVTSPTLVGLECRLNRKYGYKIGDELGGIFRSPTLGSEWTPPVKVVGYTQKGIEVSQDIMDMVTGDTDGDFLTVLTYPYIDRERYMQRWNALRAALGGSVDDAIKGRQLALTPLTAVLKVAMSKAGVSTIGDPSMTEATFATTGDDVLLTDAQVAAVKRTNAWVDFAKKDTAISFVDAKVPGIYRMLGTKFGTASTFNQMLLDAVGYVQSMPAGRLKTLLDRVVHALPAVVLPSRPGRELDFAQKKFAQLHGSLPREEWLRPEICKPAERHMFGEYMSSLPMVTAIAEAIVARYKRVIDVMRNAETDVDLAIAHRLEDELYADIAGSNDMRVSYALRHIAGSILSGRKDRVMGSARILVTVPMTHFRQGGGTYCYDLDRIIAEWRERTHYAPEYFIGVVYAGERPDTTTPRKVKADVVVIRK